MMSRWADGESRRCRGRSGQLGSRARAERLSWSAMIGRRICVRARSGAGARSQRDGESQRCSGRQGTSVLADCTRSARAAARGVQRVSVDDQRQGASPGQRDEEGTGSTTESTGRLMEIPQERQIDFRRAWT